MIPRKFHVISTGYFNILGNEYDWLLITAIGPSASKLNLEILQCFLAGVMDMLHKVAERRIASSSRFMKRLCS